MHIAVGRETSKFNRLIVSGDPFRLTSVFSIPLFSSVCYCFTAVLLKVFHLAFHLFYSRLTAFVV